MPTWLTIKITSNAVSKNIIFAGILIHIVYYLKIGGFDTSSLEITLLGTLLLCVSSLICNLAIPNEIRLFDSKSDFEKISQENYSQNWRGKNYFLNSIKFKPLRKCEWEEHGYRLDKKFNGSIEDFNNTLSDIELISLISNINYCRINHSKAFLRFIITALIVLGALLIYWKPLSLLYKIYL